MNVFVGVCQKCSGALTAVPIAHRGDRLLRSHCPGQNSCELRHIIIPLDLSLARIDLPLFPNANRTFLFLSLSLSFFSTLPFPLFRPFSLFLSIVHDGALYSTYYMHQDPVQPPRTHRLSIRLAPTHIWAILCESLKSKIPFFSLTLFFWTLRYFFFFLFPQ